MFEDQDDLLPEMPEEDEGEFEEVGEEVPSDTPEEITEEEASRSTIPLEVQEDHIAAMVCDVCQELNLTENVNCIECMKCGKPYCYHFASAVDVLYCVNCMSDISVTKQTITKSYEHKNEETGQTTYYRRRAKEIKIEGQSWLFAQRRITELSDVELDLTIEYHRNIYSLLMAEAEKRRTEKMHRYANAKVSPSTGGAKVTENTTTTVKKTRTISKNKAQEQAAAILNSLKAKGMDINAILSALKK